MNGNSSVRHRQIPVHLLEPPVVHAPDDVLALHTTDRQTFKQCRRKWMFSSPWQLNLEKVWPDEKLWLGKLVHEALAIAYAPRPVEQRYKHEYYLPYPVAQETQPRVLKIEDPKPSMLEAIYELVWKARRQELLQRLNWQGLSHEQEQQLVDMLDLGRDMMHNYRLWAERHDDFQTIATEIPFSVPIVDYRTGEIQKGTYDGHIDNVVIRYGRDYWLGEYKTAAQMRSADRLQWDEQWGSYVWALERSAHTPVPDGKRIMGVMYTELRKKKVKRPELVYQGTRVSCNKSCDTSVDIWLETLAGVVKWEGTLVDLEKKVRIEGTSDYVKMLDHLHDKETEGKGYVRRTWVRRSRDEVEEIGKRICHEYFEMRNPPHVCPTPTWDCLWRCDFREVCLAMSDGADVTDYLYGTGEFQERKGYYGDVRDDGYDQ